MKKERMKTALLVAALLLCALFAVTVSAQTNGTAGMDPAEVDRIIRTFTAKEAQFRKALNTYSFKRDALIQSIGMGGQVIGEYHRVSTFTFDDQGERFEKISFFPMSTLPEITQEDIDDLGRCQSVCSGAEQGQPLQLSICGQRKDRRTRPLHI